MFARFWYFVIATVAGAALALAFLAHAAFEREARTNVDDHVRRDRFEVELWLRLDAQARLDAIRPMTVNADIASGLEESNARPAGQLLAAGTRTRVETTLGALNRQLDEGAADVLVAVDKDADIVAQVGGGVPELNAHLRALPLVMDALRGEEKEDLWLRNDVLLRVVARPVHRGGAIVGAIVYATEVDDDLTHRLADRLKGPSVAFFHGERLVAFTGGTADEAAPGRDALADGLAGARQDPALASEERTGPRALGETALAIYALFRGKPLEGSVGYVVARSLPAATSPFGLISAAPSQDVTSLPWALIVVVPLLLGLLGIVFSMVERDRPLAKLHEAIKQIAKNGAGTIPSGDFRGPFRILAEDVNEAVERIGQTSGAAAAHRRSTNLDELLGGSPAPAAGNAYFGFAPKAGADDIPDVPPMRTPATPPPPAAQRAPARPTPTPVVTKAPPPPAPKAPPAPAKAPPAPAAATLPDFEAPPAGPEPGHEDDDDGETMVAQIPKELLAASGENDLELEHFRGVYDEFIAVKEQCGEPTAGVTFDKFIVTLRRNKEQIVSKHGAKSVRFTVYVKDGKAALKATPVK